MLMVTVPSTAFPSSSATFIDISAGLPVHTLSAFTVTVVSYCVLTSNPMFTFASDDFTVMLFKPSAAV